MIKGYKEGDNITLLNVIYHKPKKNEETQKWSNGSIDIIYKDIDKNKKGVQHIDNPEYTYYMLNDDCHISTNELFIDKSLVHPVTCKYKDLKKSIAENTNNLDAYYDNLRNGNSRANDDLFKIATVFNADMNIEDYYRMMFDRLYKNEPYKLHNLYFDIEVDGINQAGDFPEPGECPVNAVTLVSDVNNTVYTLLLENDKNPLIEEFKQIKGLPEQIKDFVRENVGGWKNEIRYELDKFEYKLIFYSEEIKLIHDVFNIINILQPDFALAWNMAFDLPYLIARIQRLGYDPIEIIPHPEFKEKEAWYFIDKRAEKFEEKGDYAQISAYTVYIDQLITFASRRKGQRAYSSFKLDYIGNKIAKVRKLDYSNITTNIAKLPYLNYYIFVFYNIMDTIVQKCIESKVGDVNYIFMKCNINNTRYSKAHRQTTYLFNRGIKDFYNDGFIMGCNVNKSNEKVGFPGAFVADPNKVSDTAKLKINDRPVNIVDNLNDFDYKRLYPSIIFQNNMAPNTMIGKIFLPDKLDPNEDRFNNEYFDRTVAFIEDFLSGNYIEFGSRYLNLAGYEQMYDDINEYFKTVRNPIYGLRSYDCISGNRYLARVCVPNDNKVMAIAVDRDTKKIMARKCMKMPERK